MSSNVPPDDIPSGEPHNGENKCMGIGGSSGDNLSATTVKLGAGQHSIFYKTALALYSEVFCH